ncbi:MAG: hypothetical protein IKU07_05290 [Oscillospiraceae bacterium]|nr:hypothetical protein [Oscillospiraceae bacterium]
MDYIVVKENIRDAVTEACRRDIRTVVIPEGTWHLTQPVQLPGAVTVILANATVIAEGCAFCNEKGSLPYALATEQQDIHILGFGKAAIQSCGETAVQLYNVKNFSVSGISFRGGVQLRHARKGRVQRLSFADCAWGIRVEEGCRELILEDISGETKEELLLFCGGDTTVWGRSNELCQLLAKRICGKTQAAPLVSLRQGAVEAENIIFWDITDNTVAPGCAVLLGEGEASVRDVTVRRAAANRTLVKIGDSCDGIYAGGTAEVSPKANRVLTAAAEAPALPCCEKDSTVTWISANEEAYRGMTDAGTLENAIAAAVQKNAVLVIPRYNARTGAMLWQLDKTLRLPVGLKLVLLDAHLRMEDHTYCNMFLAETTGKISIRGIGSATLDSGKPNGLKRRTAGKFGFGAITDNALVRLRGCTHAEIRDLHICQSRFFGIYCEDSIHVQLRDLDYYAPGIFPDLGGVYIAGGCSGVRVENITGIMGADCVLVEASRNAGSGDIRDVKVNTLLANPCRYSMVRIFCQDGYRVQNVSVSGILDSSVPEQKMQPRAMVGIGRWDGWLEKQVAPGDLAQVRVQDICGRSAATVELGGCSRDVALENIHTFGNTGSALLSAPEPEVTEFILMDTQKQLCAHTREKLTHLEAARADGIFFRCIQASAYMRGTATSIISDKKKFVGTVLELSGLETEGLTVKNIFAKPVGNGIRVTGKARVEVEDLQLELCGREETVCGTGCTLLLDGKIQEITPTVKL